MRTYWDAFIEDYGEKMSKITTVKLLEAFWLYSNNKHEECDKIMNKKTDTTNA